MKQVDVICIGVAIIDSIIRGFDPVPVSATGYRAASGTLNPGGDAVNEAVVSARLGLRTAIMSALGTDAAGDMLLAALTESGVDTSLASRSPEHPTPVTTIFVKEDGNRRSITNASHNYNFHPERYGEALEKTRAVILGSLFRAPFNDPCVIRSVVSKAKTEGALVFADTKLPNFRKLSLAEISDSLPLIDYITPNLDEARYYTGKESPEEMADVFLQYGARNVIIKMGVDGCYFRNAETGFYVPAFRVEAIDATGAGDSFLAGFVCEILRGAEPKEALRFASACGAICTTRVGACAALESREQVLAFLKEAE